VAWSFRFNNGKRSCNTDAIDDGGAVSKVDYEKLNAFLFEESLPTILKRAEGGDLHAASQALPALAALLSTSHVHPTSREVLPVPSYAREYLSKALWRMVGGADPSEAFHLKKKHKPKDPYLRKLLAGYLVEQGRVDHGMSVEKAIDFAVDAIHEILKQQREGTFWGPWSIFKGKNHYDAGVVKKYYYDKAVQAALKDGFSAAASE